MKKLFIFIFIPFWLFGQNEDDFCEQFQHLQVVLNENHYQPKELNETLSISIFDLVLSIIDEDREFLTQDDLSLLREYKTNLHTFLKENDCSFTDKYVTVFSNNISFIKQYLNKLKLEKFDYSRKDIVTFRAIKNREFFKNQKALEVYWNERIRYLILKSFIENFSDKKENDFAALESSIKTDIIDNQLCYLDEITSYKGGIKNYIKYAFLDAFAKYHDPHSSFFTFSEKQIFENTLVKTQESFGIITKKNKFSEIIVQEIIAGSPAFKAENIYKGDKIIKITSDEHTLNTICVSNRHVLEFLNNKNHKKINIILVSKNGIKNNIELIKNKVELEDNAIRSYILGDTFKVGYIKIPSFYTDNRSFFGSGITNDVSKEIFKLQRENIQALILNLRFNGGGSMKEAVELSGLFINKGPITSLKENTGKLSVLKDYKRGSAFSKPLVVLVNGQSASASELFAGAMQDYKRAIIVGSPTFGKATSQVILPLHKFKNLGYCKVTSGKFYRITGKTHQELGVQPDIILPTIYDGFNIGEKYLPHFLHSNSIDKKLKYETLQIINKKQLVEKSNIRVHKSNVFNKIIRISSDFKNIVLKTRNYPLTIKNVRADIKKINFIFEDFKKNLDEETILVKNTKSTIELLSYSTIEKKQNKDVLDKISKNIYIIEAYKILTDLKAQH